MYSRKLFLWVNVGLIVAILIGGGFLGVMLLQGSSSTKVAQGVSYNVIYVKSTQIRVEFGNFSENMSFSEAIIDVMAPNGVESTADITAGVLSYAQDTGQTTRESLSNISISSTGKLEKGSSFTLNHYRDLLIGAWSFKLTHRESDKTISSGTIIVPDTDTAPAGEFSTLVNVSSSEIRLMVGSVTPITQLSYCYIEVWGPEMTAMTMYMNDTTTMDLVLQDGTLLRMVDGNKDGLLNAQDHVDLNRWSVDLARGQWSVSLRDVFTGDMVAIAVFNLG